ncbi:MAG: hypothetical protein JKX69_11285 [Rhodobacteraceae bacterium]|nr:hypothetical protein [Paracoccaceae bacterium]
MASSGRKRGAALSVNTPFGQRQFSLSSRVPLLKSARSLILGLHGGSGDAKRFAQRSGLAEASHELGHNIAFPQALSHWADGRPPLEKGWEADLSLVRSMMQVQAKKNGNVHMPTAIVGGSNGGMFAYRLACELPLGAVVGVASAMPVAFANNAKPGPPVPAMIVQATNDRFIPWDGGQVALAPHLGIAGELLSADAVIDFWLKRNKCSGPPKRRNATLSSFGVEIFAWDGGANGADLWRVVLRGAGHKLLDRAPGAKLKGSLEELIARFVIYHIDRQTFATARH